MTETFYLGVDPGASGGLAALSKHGVTAVPMPATDRDVWTWFSFFKEAEVYAVLERVQGFIGNAHPGSRMFQFGQSYGLLRMALTAAGVVWQEVTPGTWQRALGTVPRGKTEGKTEFKNRLKQRAQQLFPKVNVTLKTADALLLAHYCRQHFSSL